MRKQIFIGFLYLFISLNSFPQFRIDAGRDTSFCLGKITMRLGGSPTATGGDEPYTYTWTCHYKLNGIWFPAFTLLDNPAAANPAIHEGNPINDSIVFHLTVKDAGNQIRTDSVKVIISSVLLTLLPNSATINRGDSTQIAFTNFTGGIPPFSYHWVPEKWVTDPHLLTSYIKPDSTISYRIFQTDAIGCQSFDYFSVVVQPLRTISLNESVQAAVFPNPLTFNSIISIKDNYPAELFIKAFDKNGRTILNERFYNHFRIGEKIFRHGVYLYTICEINRVVATGRFVIK